MIGSARRRRHLRLVEELDHLLFISDAAINIAPDLEDKADIVRNAIDLALALGVAVPHVALLAAVETVTSKMPATIDAAALCKMAERGQIASFRLNGKHVYAFAPFVVGIYEFQLERLDAEITVLLLPSDPNDARNLFLEIRAGTGGDEATLFAAETIHARWNWTAILRRQVDLRYVQLERPRLALAGVAQRARQAFQRGFIGFRQFARAFPDAVFQFCIQDA